MPASKLSDPKAPKAPRPTRKIIERRTECDDERKAHGRSAAKLKKEQDAIDADLIAYVVQTEPSKRTLRTCGHELAVVTPTSAERVAWREEYVRLKGEAAATRLEEQAAKKEKTGKQKIEIRRL